MDLAGWIQVLSIIGSLLMILAIFWNIAMKYAKIKSLAEKANARIDNIDANAKGVCLMGKQIEARVDDHENRLRKVEDSGARTEEHVKQIEKNVAEINEKIDKVLLAVKK